MYLDELYFPHGSKFFPFRLRDDQALPTRHVIGGSPPVGIAPKLHTKTSFYFGTLGLSADTDVSMFCHFDYEDEQSPLHFFTASYRLWPDTAGYVELIPHPRAARSDAVHTHAAQLPQLRFKFLSPGLDPSELSASAYASNQIYPEHKVGGLPYFGQLEGTALDNALLARREGYMHVLQLAFPGPEDTLIDADWPFGELVFHVFARRSESDGRFEFRYGWG